jgi:hypothetical protein
MSNMFSKQMETLVRSLLAGVLTELSVLMASPENFTQITWYTVGFICLRQLVALAHDMITTDKPMNTF